MSKLIKYCSLTISFLCLNFGNSNSQNCLEYPEIEAAVCTSFDPISFDLLSFDQDCKHLEFIKVVVIKVGAGQASYSIDGLNFQENNAL